MQEPIRTLFIAELERVLGGNNAPIEDDMSGISKPGIDDEGPDGGLDGSSSFDSSEM